MLNRLSGVRARPKVNSAQLTQWLEQRHLGRYWEAQKILTMAGDPKATEVYMSMIRKGYYQQWNSCYLDALPWKLTDVPRVLEWASATCCTRVEVEAIWKGLFGNNSVKSVFRGQKFAPLRERLAQHWQIHQGSLRYSKIARHFMPGPTKKR